MEPEILFIKSDEVAKILRVSKRTLQNYRTEGKLVYYQFSKKNILYRKIDVIDFLKNSSSCSYDKDTINRLIQKNVVKL